VADFAGSFLSRTKCQLDLQALDEPMDEADLLNTLKTQPLVRTGGLRCFYVDATVGEGVCYVDGERHAFGAKAQAAVMALCDHDTVSHTLLRAGLKNPQLVATLTQWVNAGYWYFND
jgi:50S ribosomal protein L16 3-hydroxylase